MTLQLVEGTDEFFIVGLSLKVWRELGFSMLESVYERALMIELKKAGFSAERQVPVDVFYDGKKLNYGYAADIIVENRIVLELKTATRLYAIHRRQIQFYLAASGIQNGLLIHFGNARKLEYERFERKESGYSLYGVPPIPEEVLGEGISDTSVSPSSAYVAPESGSLEERVNMVLGGDAKSGGDAETGEDA